MTKYYLIEKYETGHWHDQRDGSSGCRTSYDVSVFRSKSELEGAILKGPRHNGTLMPAMGLEFKVEVSITPEDDDYGDEFH